MFFVILLLILIALGFIDYRLNRLLDQQEKHHQDLLVQLKSIQNALEK